MKAQKKNKKPWLKPQVKILNIKKDTFGGSGKAAENAVGLPPASRKPV